MAKKKNNTNEIEQNQAYQPNPYEGMVPLSYRMVSSGITPAPRPSSMVQLPPVVVPLSVVPYVTEDQAVWQYDDQQQY